MNNKRLEQWRDILVRTGKTFIEAFLGYLTIDGFFGVTSYTGIKKVLLSMLVGAAAAGVTAVWNMLIHWLTVKIDDIGEEDEIEQQLKKFYEGSDDDDENE